MTTKQTNFLLAATLVCLVAAPGMAHAQSGLVGAWNFNAGTGSTVADATGNNNTGTIAGATWSTLGKNGNALSFDGVNDVITIPSSASLSLTTGMTLSAWIIPTANQSGWRAIVQREVDSYFLHAGTSANTLVPAGGGIFSGTNTYTEATNTIPVNVWTHLALTYDGTTIRLFVNGAQVGSRAQSGVIENNGTPIRIGGNSPYVEFFQGRIDDVRIYNRALNATEIQSDMAVGVGGSAPDVTVPSVAITTPTTNPTHSVTTTPLTLGGTASDNVGVTQVTWANDRGGSGTATGTTSWSAANIALQSGANVVTVTARDAAGNTATDVITVTYTPPDVTAPTVAITTPTTNPTHSVTTTPLTVGGTASDNVGVTQVTWVNDRGGSGTATGTTSWSAANIALQSGANAITVTARDAAGNTATDVITVTYTPADVILPTIAIETPTTNPTHAVTTSPVSVGGTASDNVGVTQVTWVNDRGGSGTASGTTSWSAANIVLLAGDNVITVTARDAAGNTATDVITVTYSPPDVTVPVVTITSPTANPTHSVSATPLTVGGTASDNVGVTQVTWVNDRGGSGTATGTSSWSAPGIALLSGDNVITVTARDAAGNTATDVMTVTYTPPDVTVPAITIETPTANPTHSVTSSPLTLGGTASDNVGVTQVTWVNDRGGSGTATGTASWSAAGIALLAGDNVVTVTARDAAGNTANDVITVTYTPPDVTVPTITITSPTSNPTLAVSATPVTLGGTAGDNVGVTQVTWVNDRGGSGTAAGTTSWSAAGIALLDGANVVTVTARDAAGNTATDVITVTYTPPDGTVPTVAITTPTSNPTHATSTSPLTVGGTASDNVGVTQVTWVNDRGGSGTATGTTAWSAAVALLSGDNNITVTARDAAGNTATDLLTVTYTPPATPPGLVAAWAFNEGSGTTVADATTNNNTGTISGAVWSTLGKNGNALSFDGVNDVVVVPNSASLGLSTGMTLSAWVFLTGSQSGWRAIIQKEVDAYFLHASNTSGPRRPAGGGIFGGVNDYVTSTSALTTSTWTHLALTYDGATMRLFVNGAQVASKARTGAIQNTSTPLRIGGNAPYIEFFQGRIDDVRVYNRALSATEIQTDMAVGVGGSTPPPPDVTAPTVAITTPTSNPTHSVTTTPLTVAGTAGDNIAVTQVTWTNDRGGSGTATGTTSWSAANLALQSGANVITVTARDAAGNTATDVLTVTYTPADVTVPTVAITTPTSNPTHAVSATPLTVGGTASDNVGVTQVTWVNDRGGSGTATGTTSWSAANIALVSGDNVITVTARDAAGNTATDAITVTYTPSDVTVPTVAITTPTTNPTHTTTTTPVTLAGTASDDVAVTQVTWVNDRGGSGTATGTTSWTAAGIALVGGDNVVTVTARDAAGNTASDVITVSYTPPAQPAGLVAGWNFNEGSGTTVADVSGNSNTGSVTGPAWSTLGKNGNALSFDGSNDIVLVPHSASLNLTNGSTISAWVFPTAAQSGWRAIVQKEVDAYYLHAGNSGGDLHPAAGGTFGGAGAYIQAPGAITVNTWTHLAATYDGATLRLFINGTQVASQPQTGAWESNTNPVRIGGNSPYIEFFQGRIDDVRIYNRALTATEIQSDMTVGVAPSAPRLVLLQPTPGSVISSTTVPVQYSASGDLTGVNHVHFTLDANPQVMDLSFDGSYQFTDVPTGSHLLKGYLARADHSKIDGTDDSVAFQTTGPDQTPPIVSVTAPAGGTTVAGTITVSASASDDVGVAGVQFFVDGAAIGAEDTAVPYSVSWNTTTAGNGSRSLTARARDAAGNQTTSTPVVVTVNNGTSNDPAVVGLWSQVYNWPMVAIHAALMPNGKVLAWDDHTNDVGSGVWDPATLVVTNAPFNSANLFCAGPALLPDGRVFVAGGHIDVHVGIKNATLFNSVTQSWTSAAPMQYARWYPTVTTLPDGRMLTLAGEENCNECNALRPEIFDPANGTWTQLNSAQLDLPYYPHVFVLPDGRIVVSSSNRREMPTYTLDVATQTWTTIDPQALHGGSAVQYAPGKIMKSGRGRDPDLPGAPSVATTYVIDMNVPVPAWRQTTSMAYERTEHNLTLLPDGTVLAIGGGVNSDVFDPNAPVRQPELWDPVTEGWRLLASHQQARIYHSIALLLPDGRVLSAGGGRYGPSFLDAEIYSPPYLFKGPRPTITAAPATVSYGADFFLETPNGAGVAKISLMGLGAVTHAFDANQRIVSLTFQQTAGGLTVQAPANANLAPPGHYMVFIVDANGVPSVAPIVRIQ